MAPSATQSVGFEAEDQALRYLARRGLRCIRRNYTCRAGEIDLILLDGRCLVFVEVRYRRANRISGAAQSVDYRKQQKLIRAARTFLAGTPKYVQYTMRFDVMAIDRLPDGSAETNWVRDAFRPGFD